MMRVITGSAKGLKLKTLPGVETRPTTDRIKETLFNMISDSVVEARFLDLFSGSGAIGIEALSRGAKEAVFVENNRKAVNIIRENLQHTKLLEKSKIITQDVLTAINILDSQDSFDVIFMDPPYENHVERKVLEALDFSTLVDTQTLIIVEASKETSFDFLENLHLKIVREKFYKTNKHIFIRRR